LAGTAVVILVIRLALLQDNRAIALTTTALAALFWVILLGVVQRRIRRLHRLSRPSRWMLVICSAACACFGALGVVLTLA